MKLSKILLVLLLPFVLSGCFIKIKDSTKSDGGGGFYRSVDGGLIWEQKVLVPTTQPVKKSIAGVNVINMDLDSQDPIALYLGTAQHGLVYTYDAGENWQGVRGLNVGKVNEVIVDPKNKCIIYVSITNKVLRSSDCTRTWEQIYFDSKLDEEILSVAIDPNNTSALYIGLKRGDILKSSDAGKTWVYLKSLDNKIVDIVVSNADSSIVYVATVSAGIFKSIDAGSNWTNINQAFGEFSGALQQVTDLILDATSSVLYVVTKQAIFVSDTGDNIFRKMPTLQAKDRNAATIYSFAVNPSNNQELYYATDTTFYKSVDGGNQWSAKNLPAGRSGTIIKVNPKNPNVLYLGIYNLAK